MFKFYYSIHSENKYRKYEEAKISKDLIEVIKLVKELNDDDIIYLEEIEFKNQLAIKCSFENEFFLEITNSKNEVFNKDCQIQDVEKITENIREYLSAPEKYGFKFSEF